MKNDPRHASTQSNGQNPNTPDPGQNPGTQNPGQPNTDPQVRPDGIESPEKQPIEFPGKPQRDMPMPDRERASGTQQVEGEGSYTASRNYRDGLEHSVQQGNSERLADDAAKALDGPEGAELRQAEQQGKQGRPMAGKRQDQPTSQR